MKLVKSLFGLMLFSFLLTTTFAVKAQSDWTLKKEKDGIRIYTRKSASSAFDELKVETLLPGKMSTLAAVLLDIPDHINWVYNAKSASVIKKINESELIFYTQINAPFPATDRDLVVHLKIKQDPGTRLMTVTAKNVSGYVAPKPKVVRVALSDEVWSVTPIAHEMLKVEYYLRIDPGGSSPAWLLNLFLEKGPMESFTNLKDQLHLPRYVNAVLPFIKD